MTRYIGLISGKGGTGKTTSAINLGAALNCFGKNVIVVDGNVTTPNIGLHLGVPIVPISLHHVLQGKYQMRKAVYKHYSGMKVVPASIALSDLRNANLDRMPKAIKSLIADFVIIDGAPGLGRETSAVINSSEELLIVTNPEMPALTDALKSIRIAESSGKDVLGVLLTRTKSDKDDIGVSSIEALLEKPVLAIIPEDKAVRNSLKKRDAVVHTHPNSKVSLGYKNLAAMLCGLDLGNEQKGWLNRLFGRLFGKRNA